MKEQHSEPVMNLLLQASDKWFDKRYEEAIELYNQVIKIDPKCHDAFNGLRNVYVNQHKHQEAIKACRSAIEVAPKEKQYMYYLFMVQSHRELNEYLEVSQAFDMVISLTNGELSYFHERANFYEEIGAYANRWKDLQQVKSRLVKEQRPSGRIEAQIKECEDKLKAKAAQPTELPFSSSSSSSSSSAAASGFSTIYLQNELRVQLSERYTYLGIIKCKEHEQAEAEKAFTQAIKLDPSNARAFYKRGGIRLEQERYEEAAADLEKVVTFGPENLKDQFRAQLAECNSALEQQRRKNECAGTLANMHLVTERPDVQMLAVDNVVSSGFALSVQQKSESSRRSSSLELGANYTAREMSRREQGKKERKSKE
jgi:tetratricopeptide (TPR) repeat protein